MMAVAAWTANGVWHGSPIGLLSYFIVKLTFRHIFQGSQIFLYQFMLSHQEKWESFLEDLQRVWTTCPRHLLFIAFWILRIPALAVDLFQGCFWIAVPVEALSSFAAMVFRRAEYGLDVSSGWIISPIVVGPRECLDRVYRYGRPSVAAKPFWQISSPSSSYLALWTRPRVYLISWSTTSRPANRRHLRLR